ncbi:hypothetical protein ZHAS_00009640 [Anopheles sinensis]|uniref:Uncharacterized protein n=1 Tax=Anopheles sinensis TaxID=74873 RepID=A0A084VVR3_ANOSI|nr:hypothetical protein ZHAS_00009640 [Anopheles sinensis]
MTQTAPVAAVADGTPERLCNVGWTPSRHQPGTDERSTVRWRAADSATAQWQQHQLQSS